MAVDLQSKFLIRDLRRILAVLPHKTTWQVASLFFLMIILAFIEVLSIFSMSFMAMTVAVPDAIMSHHIVQAIFRRLPNIAEFCSDPRAFTLLSSCLVVLLIILKNIVTAVTYWRSAVIGQDIAIYAGTTVIDNFLHSDYIEHLSGNSGAMFQVLSWRQNLGMFTICILNIYTYALASFALFLTVISATPGVILGVLIFVSVLVVVIYRSMRGAIEKYSTKVTEIDSHTNKIAMTAMNGILEVILYRQQPVFYNKFKDECMQGRIPQSFINIAPPIPSWILECFGFIAIPTTVGILIFVKNADMMLITGVITMIMLVAWRVLPLLNRSLGSLVQLRSLRPMVMQCLEKLEQIKTKPARQLPKPNPNFHFGSKITLENISFCYPGSKKQSLDHISLTIEHGEQVGFIGQSGSGKTTLAGILSGLMSFDAGQMSIDGKILTPEDKAAYIRHIGYVTQSPYIFSGTIAENVSFSEWGKPYDRERVLKACRMASLDIVETVPQGIEYKIGDNGAGGGLSFQAERPPGRLESDVSLGEMK